VLGLAKGGALAYKDLIKGTGGKSSTLIRSDRKSNRWEGKKKVQRGAKEWVWIKKKAAKKSHSGEAREGLTALQK